MLLFLFLTRFFRKDVWWGWLRACCSWNVLVGIVSSVHGWLYVVLVHYWRFASACLVEMASESLFGCYVHFVIKITALTGSIVSFERTSSRVALPFEVRLLLHPLAHPFPGRQNFIIDLHRFWLLPLMLPSANLDLFQIMIIIVITRADIVPSWTFPPCYRRNHRVAVLSQTWSQFAVLLELLADFLLVVVWGLGR